MVRINTNEKDSDSNSTIRVLHTAQRRATTHAGSLHLTAYTGPHAFPDALPPYSLLPTPYSLLPAPCYNELRCERVLIPGTARRGHVMTNLNTGVQDDV